MTIKTGLVALVLTLAPGLAFASCYGGPHQTTASACADGQVWDATAMICITPQTS